MALGMKSTYTKKGQSAVCRNFTDGSKVCMSKKGWSVFFATINKMKADETKPRPKQTQEAKELLIQWFTESALQSSVDGIPKWVYIAEKLVNSETSTPQVKKYWGTKLDEYRGENAKKLRRNKELRMAVNSVLGLIDKEIKKMEN